MKYKVSHLVPLLVCLSNGVSHGVHVASSCSCQRTRLADPMRLVHVRPHAFCPSQMCRSCVRTRRWSGHLSCVFLCRKRVCKAQTRPPISCHRKLECCPSTTQTDFVFSQELHSYPIFSDDWGADEYVILSSYQLNFSSPSCYD